MNFTIPKVVILLFLNIFVVSALECENGNCHNFDLIKLIENNIKNINVSKALKLISDEDREFIKEFEKSISPLSTLSSLFYSLSETSSNKCVEDLKYVFDSVLTLSGWSMKMLDSYGKPESGVLLGNAMWIGDYDECLSIQAPPKFNSSAGNFRGQYCTLGIPLKLGRTSLPISTAVCLPDSCNPNRTAVSILQYYNLNGSLIDVDRRIESAFGNATLTCKPAPRKLTGGAIAVIFLLSIFGLLAVIGSSITAFEYFMKSKSSKVCKSGIINQADSENASQRETNDSSMALPAWLEKIKPFFNCFCIFTNGEKILNTAGSEGQLPCLHGIRFLSMTWVILAHTYSGVHAIVKNGIGSINLIDHWTFQIVLNAIYSVDSFFLLSGFLVAYLFFQQAQKTNGKIPWLYFYIHRYVRLTPVYMIAVAYFAALGYFLGTGPLWPDFTSLATQNCRENWWGNALYINNFQIEKQCMAWSWYLANDMQFYIISPLFLISLWRWPKVGYSLIGLFFCMTFVTNFVLTLHYNLIPGLSTVTAHINEFQKYNDRVTDYFIIAYYKPYTRIGPYLLGLALAYYLHKRKQNNSSPLNLVSLSLGWAIASAVTLACMFGLYHQKVTKVGAAFYNALTHTGFGLGLAWVIFVCVIGQGGVINSMLSWKPLIPLSRLTYCAYLFHPFVLNAYLYSVRTLTYFNHINVIMIHLAFVVLSYAVAMVISLVFESPVIRLERLIRNRFSS